MVHSKDRLADRLLPYLKAKFAQPHITQMSLEMTPLSCSTTHPNPVTFKKQKEGQKHHTYRQPKEYAKKALRNHCKHDFTKPEPKDQPQQMEKKRPHESLVFESYFCSHLVECNHFTNRKMSLTEQDIAKKLGFRRVLIPILIGLGVATWLLIDNLNDITFSPAEGTTGTYIWKDSNGNGKVDKSIAAEFIAVKNAPPEGTPTYIQTTPAASLKNIEWSWSTTFWMLIALLMVAVRDLGYMYRIRVMTDNKLSWRQAFEVIMLWEFASAITPSVVGGSGVALFIVNREGIPMGKSTAIVMVTAMLDELFYIIMVPIVLLIVGTESLFVLSQDQTIMGMELNTELIFWMGYGFLVFLTLLIVLGVFIRPQGTKKVLVAICKIRFMKRWRQKAVETGDGIIATSKELKGKPIMFWVKTFGATFFSWTARFWIVNFMILAFVSHSFADNMMIYARQLVMWVIMLISPTPGGAGVAEFAFSGFLADFMPVAVPVIVMAILWRLFSYYPYLFIGSLILPRWLKRTSMDRANDKNEEEAI